MDLSLRLTFDREAEAYHRSRPAPPVALVEAMLEQGGLQACDRVLEVGCGTGQATVPLAEFGLEVHALELGPSLAALAHERLALYPNVTVEQGAFETFTSDTPFDALVSVQAFHWIEPGFGLSHAASLLHPDGALLLAWHQDRRQDTVFERAVDPVYDRYEAPLKLERPTPNATAANMVEALVTSADFYGLQIMRFPWQEIYPKWRYLELLTTFSNVQAIDAAARSAFLGEIADLVDAHGGIVVRVYESLLLSARRAP